jgi:hypothetical protein
VHDDVIEYLKLLVEHAKKEGMEKEEKSCLLEIKKY